VAGGGQEAGVRSVGLAAAVRLSGGRAPGRSERVRHARARPSAPR
jgi:hypothetical protein